MEGSSPPFISCWEEGYFVVGSSPFCSRPVFCVLRCSSEHKYHEVSLYVSLSSFVLHYNNIHISNRIFILLLKFQLLHLRFIITSASEHFSALLSPAPPHITVYRNHLLLESRKLPISCTPNLITYLRLSSIRSTDQS